MLKNRRIPHLMILCSCLYSFPVLASHEQHRQHHHYDEYKTNFGITSYALNVGYDRKYLNDEFSGLGIFMTHALSNSTALRGGVYSLEHLVKNRQAQGIDVQLLLGNNFERPGMKFYGGVGLYSETWKIANISEDYGGAQLIFGMGANFSVLSVDWWVALRSSGDYSASATKEAGFPITTGAANGGLMFSIRF